MAVTRTYVQEGQGDLRGANVNMGQMFAKGRGRQAKQLNMTY